MSKKNNVMAFDVEEMMACDHMHDMFDEQFDVMLELMKTQQQTGLELTKLVLTHGNIQNVDENKIHQLFHNAMEVVVKSYEKSFGK